MARAKRSRPDRDITPTHPNAAAIDIGATDRKSSTVINDGQHRHLTGADPSRPSDREGVQLAIARGSAGSSSSSF